MIHAVRPQPPDLIGGGASVRGGAPNSGAFAQTFRDALDGQRLRFSAHAQARLEERGIQLEAGDVQRIAESTEAAARKGARQSVVLLDKLALVVGVPSRTVVTVLEPDASDHSVFTNIDSVVVAGDSRGDSPISNRPDPFGGGLRAAD